MFKSVRSYYVKIRFVEKITLKWVERRENTQTTRSRVRNNRRVRVVISKALIKYSIWLFGGLPQRRTANGPKAELSEMTARKKKKKPNKNRTPHTSRGKCCFTREGTAVLVERYRTPPWTRRRPSGGNKKQSRGEPDDHHDRAKYGPFAFAYYRRANVSSPRAS